MKRRSPCDCPRDPRLTAQAVEALGVYHGVCHAGISQSTIAASEGVSRDLIAMLVARGQKVAWEVQRGEHLPRWLTAAPYQPPPGSRFGVLPAKRDQPHSGPYPRDRYGHAVHDCMATCGLGLPTTSHWADAGHRPSSQAFYAAFRVRGDEAQRFYERPAADGSFWQVILKRALDAAGLTADLAPTA